LVSEPYPLTYYSESGRRGIDVLGKIKRGRNADADSIAVSKGLKLKAPCFGSQNNANDNNPRLCRGK
jgi:hypothetical protein